MTIKTLELIHELLEAELNKAKEARDIAKESYESLYSSNFTDEELHQSANYKFKQEAEKRWMLVCNALQEFETQEF